MQLGCNLGYALVGSQQQPRGFHQEHLVDIVNHRSSRDFLDDSRQIDGRDVELVGIERNVVVLNKMLRNEANEVNEQFFRPFQMIILVYFLLFPNVHQIEQEHRIEHLQAILLEQMV